MKTNRKLKKALEIAKFYLDTPVECRFSSSKSPQNIEFRSNEDYTVLVNNPEISKAPPMLEIVPRNRPLESLSEVDRENIAYNEIHMFKFTLVYETLESQGIHLDKKSRSELSRFLTRHLDD